MIILAIDTTSDIGGVGLFRDSESLALIPNEGSAEQYSISLFQMVEKALAQAHLELKDVELYASANGPGSFTGIRVGLAATRAWAKVFERPVRGVSVLEAMVAKASNGVYDWCFPLLDARRSEFYVSAFRRSPKPEESTPVHHYECADEGWVMKPDAVRALLSESTTSGASATCVVRSHDRAAADFCATSPSGVISQQVEGMLVDSIAAIAAHEQRSGLPCPSSKLDAYYIRRPDAEVKLMGT